jgi:hypothetical protein
VEVVTFLLPQQADGEDVSVEEIEVSGGRGFAVRNGNSHDLVIIRDYRSNGLAQTPIIVSDFDCAWLRFIGGNSNPDEMLLLGGHRLEFEGKKIVESPERLDYRLLP